MNDINYDELDPGIRRTVKWLNDHGFTTTDSGDGTTKFKENDDTGYTGCALPWANVTVVLEYGADVLAEEADSIVKHLKDLPRPPEIGPSGGAYEELENGGWGPPKDGPVEILADYDPVSGLAMIRIIRLDDAKLEAAGAFE